MWNNFRHLCRKRYLVVANIYITNTNGCPEDEAATEAAAAAYTKAQKAATAKYNLWKLYDAVAAAKKANNAKAVKSATAKYKKAVVAAKKAMVAKK